MALGKLWNALFGKRAETVSATAIGADRSAAVVANSGGQTTKSSFASATTALIGVSSNGEASGERPVLKTKRKAIAAKNKRSAETAALTIATAPESPAAPIKRIPHPKKNAWSKLIGGHPIGTILDTHLGDATQATELLEAIVCDAVPTPKYIAIDTFELANGGLSVLEFHQRIRRVGGKAVPIPGSIDDGLRHLSRTLGTVDLVLLDESNHDWTSSETRRLLSHVTHGKTLLLRRDSRDKWNIVEPSVLTITSTKATSSSRLIITKAA